jgi:N-formylglutamate amidohydrolase
MAMVGEPFATDLAQLLLLQASQNNCDSHWDELPAVLTRLGAALLASNEPARAAVVLAYARDWLWSVNDIFFI